MNIEDLVGYRLGSCCFSRGGYSFDFDGIGCNKYKSFTVSAPAYLCGLNLREDVEEKCSALVFDLLERVLTSVSAEEETNSVEFVFDNQKGFVIWFDDNGFELLTVHSSDGEVFFSIF